MSNIDKVKIGSRLPKTMFLNERVVNLFLIIEGQSLSEASKMVGINYLQSRRYLFYWEYLTLVNIRRMKKSFNIIHTAKGKRVHDALIASKTVLQNLGVQFVG